MLSCILLRMQPEVTFSFVVGGVIRNCIELMVTHHGKCVSRVDHRSRNIDHLTLVIASIDKITQEDYFARRMTIDARLVLIPKLGQNRSQALAMPVYIANDVISYYILTHLEIRLLLLNSYRHLQNIQT